MSISLVLANANIHNLNPYQDTEYYYTPESSIKSLLGNPCPILQSYYLDFLFHHRLVLPVLELHRNGNIYSILLCKAFFIQYNVLEIHPCWCMCHCFYFFLINLFIHSPIDGHLGCSSLVLL